MADEEKREPLPTRIELLVSAILLIAIFLALASA